MCVYIYHTYYICKIILSYMYDYIIIYIYIHSCVYIGIEICLEKLATLLWRLTSPRSTGQVSKLEVPGELMA